MFIFRPHSKVKSKCAFLQESQESLRDEVFREGIFGQDVNWVAAREERHGLSAWLWSSRSGNEAWGWPWRRGSGWTPCQHAPFPCRPEGKLKSQHELGSTARGFQPGEGVGPPSVTASEPALLIHCCPWLVIQSKASGTVPAGPGTCASSIVYRFH